MVTYGQVTRVRGRAPNLPYGQVTRVRGYTLGSSYGQVCRVRGQSLGSFFVYAGDPQTVTPFETVILNATAAQTPDSWVWTQLSGPSRLLTGAGAGRQFVAPPTLAGAVLTFRATAVVAGLADSSDVVTITVQAHDGWFRKQVATGTTVGSQTWILGDTPGPVPPENPTLPNLLGDAAFSVVGALRAAANPRVTVGLSASGVLAVTASVSSGRTAGFTGSGTLAATGTPILPGLGFGQTGFGTGGFGN
jgi:hypothetical protein